MAWTSKAASFSAGIAVALFALLACNPAALPHVPSLPFLATVWPQGPSNETNAFICSPQPYATQIVSTDPLLIYIHDFLSPAEVASLLASGDPLFKPSLTTKHGRTTRDKSRTSWSAGLPLSDPAVQCVLARAEAFMGTMLAPGRDEIGAPQLVRYSKGQKFDLHFDWYPRPQVSVEDKKRDRKWNRPASFFAVLEDGCEGGETWFPNVSAVAEQRGGGKEGELWRKHEEGGLAFRPVSGNALFWVNMRNGTGDERTKHAGLPVTAGMKTAMNIWPKQYVGKDAWLDEGADRD
ncbi:hypothetical protein VUR80DRAFT_10117 [Thermomyces stellatus]